MYRQYRPDHQHHTAIAETMLLTVVVLISICITSSLEANKVSANINTPTENRNNIRPQPHIIFILADDLVSLQSILLA